MGSLGHTNGINGTNGTNGHHATREFEAIVVGGGFGGCYSLYNLRKEGFSTHLIEAGSALGGVWHWNSKKLLT